MWTAMPNDLLHNQLKLGSVLLNHFGPLCQNLEDPVVLWWATMVMVNSDNLTSCYCCFETELRPGSGRETSTCSMYFYRGKISRFTVNLKPGQLLSSKSTYVLLLLDMTNLMSGKAIVFYVFFFQNENWSWYKKSKRIILNISS